MNIVYFGELIMVEDKHELTVYFDGSCSLCRIEIEHYRAQEGADAICFLDVALSDVAFSDLTRQQAMSRFHVRNGNGEIVSGAAAFVSVWRALPRWRWMSGIAEIPGVLQLMEFAYRCFLPARPIVSRIVGRLATRSSKAESNGTPL